MAPEILPSYFSRHSGLYRSTTRDPRVLDILARTAIGPTSRHR
jgi:hypothetical protein